MFAGLIASPARRDFAFLLVDRILRTALAVVLAGMIGRHLGTAAYGWLNYASAVMAFGVVVAQFGLDGIVVREVCRRPDAAEKILGAAVMLRIGMGAIVALVMFLFAPLLGGTEPTQQALVGILALGALSPTVALPALWFQSRTESRIAVRVGFAGFLAGAGLRITLLVQAAPVTAFAWAILAETAFTGFLVALAMFRRGGRFARHGAIAQCRVLLRDAWPLVVSGIAVTVYMRTDTVMLRWLADAEAVGVYAAATRLSEAAYAIPVLIATSVMATLTTASVDPERFGQLVERYFRASAVLAYTVAVPAAAIAPKLLRALFGEAFSEAGTVAQLHLISVLFVFLGVARGQVLVIRGLTKFSMAATLSGAITNIALNFLLIPDYGVYGATAATIISFAASAWLAGFIWSETRPLAKLQFAAMTTPWRSLKPKCLRS